MELPLPPHHHIHARGFSLVEMAVVVAIVGLMLGALLIPLTAQMDQRRLLETRAQLENAREALLGYAMANGRFPCPAAAPGGGTTAVEAFAPTGTTANGKCASFFNGYLPGVTLGLSPADSAGYLQDGWGNPIRYAVANLSDDANASHIFTKSAGMKNANGACTPPCSTGMSWISTQNLLYVCTSGSGITPTNCGTATQLTNGAVFVVYSTGKNTASGGTGTDEAANPNPNSTNNDAVFVSHAPTANTSANGEFDDLLEWVSSSTVFAKLVAAGQLP